MQRVVGRGEQYWPDWKDSGRRCSILIDGAVVMGEVVADDVFFTGEEEVPIFNINTDDGRYLSYPDYEDVFQYEQA